MAGERIAKMINNARTPQNEIPELVFGQVASAQPLRIRIDNSYEIDNNFDIVLSKTVQDFTITINVPTISTTMGSVNSVPVSGGKVDVDGLVSQASVVTGVNVSSQQQHIQVFRALQTGDRVKILRCGKGQRFYVLERV